MVGPSHAEERSTFAKSIGLGRKSGVPTVGAEAPVRPERKNAT
jgi:predicted transcriptional regulator